MEERATASVAKLMRHMTALKAITKESSYYNVGGQGVVMVTELFASVLSKAGYHA